MKGRELLSESVPVKNPESCGEILHRHRRKPAGGRLLPIHKHNRAAVRIPQDPYRIQAGVTHIRSKGTRTLR